MGLLEVKIRAHNAGLVLPLQNLQELSLNLKLFLPENLSSLLLVRKVYFLLELYLLCSIVQGNLLQSLKGRLAALYDLIRTDDVLINLVVELFDFGTVLVDFLEGLVDRLFETIETEKKFYFGGDLSELRQKHTVFLLQEDLSLELVQREVDAGQMQRQSLSCLALVDGDLQEPFEGLAEGLDGAGHVPEELVIDFEDLVAEEEVRPDVEVELALCRYLY